jgi:hypothetical protein
VVGGIIRSEQGRAPLAGATVELSSSQFTRRVRTDEAGRFRFGTLAPGNYRLSVLRLGFAPLSRDVLIADADADLDVTLTPDARTLMRGGDARQCHRGAGWHRRGRAIAQREWRTNTHRSVRRARAGARLATRNGNRLAWPVLSRGEKAGRYLVRVTSPGLVTQVYPVDVPRNKAVDASRLLDSARTLEAERPSYLFKEMDRRIESRGINSAIATGDEVRRYGGSMTTSLALTPGVASRGLKFTGAECVFIDGIPRRNVSMDQIRPEEVEAIEVYGLHGEATSSLRQSWQGKCAADTERQTIKNAWCG